ncbi:hypothetical protein Ae505Ps2_0067 [Pseudonocardia sp. Ae505_Ps2]|nr:hypothetical protein Ae505Ps2_0067 [Pseudonocardia sp. Ae505_Ps2]
MCRGVVSGGAATASGGWPAPVRRRSGSPRRHAARSCRSRCPGGSARAPPPGGHRCTVPPAVRRAPADLPGSGARTGCAAGAAPGRAAGPSAVSGPRPWGRRGSRGRCRRSRAPCDLLRAGERQRGRPLRHRTVPLRHQYEIAWGAWEWLGATNRPSVDGSAAHGHGIT